MSGHHPWSELRRALPDELTATASLEEEEEIDGAPTSGFTRFHACDPDDPACRCPIHDTPLVYSAVRRTHACRDVDCVHGHGVVEPPEFSDNPWAGRHVSEPDVRDPLFCRCGLARTAYVHTDGAYRSTPLTRQVWDELRGGSET